MISITIDLEGQIDRFLPGAVIRGAGTWELDTAPTRVEARLFWHTSGKASKEVVVVDSAILTSPERTGRRNFELHLPWGPYSCEGLTINIHWAIELIVFPLKKAARLDIVMAPTGTAVALEK